MTVSESTQLSFGAALLSTDGTESSGRNIMPGEEVERGGGGSAADLAAAADDDDDDEVCRESARRTPSWASRSH